VYFFYIIYKYCTSCAREMHREGNKLYVQKNRSGSRKYINRKLVCKCPTCEKLHLVHIDWVGHGMPRVYCATCRRRAEFEIE